VKLPSGALRRTLPILLLCSVTGLGACGDDDENGASDTTVTATAQEATQAPAAPGGACEPASKPPTEEREAPKPKAELDAGKIYRLVFTTSCGEFTVTLDQKRAPETAASLVSLAKRKFFDGTSFHRIVPDFVIQGGDPTASGQGGPGYSTRDKPPSDARYVRGTVAMAKTATEAPGTGGSQFFVVTAQEAPFPTPDYAIAGKVTDGLDTVEKIGRLGGPDEQSLQPVVIEKVVVEES
jgi:peptidyl-prolyl cis-trans isomerase B (cyclophilin B)